MVKLQYGFRGSQLGNREKGRKKGQYITLTLESTAFPIEKARFLARITKYRPFEDYVFPQKH
jgi:hypothetical protein